MQLTGPFNKELLSVLPKTLKYICHNGAGYDNIDVPACSQKGAFVFRTRIGSWGSIVYRRARRARRR